jgi:hypothetical protein
MRNLRNRNAIVQRDEFDRVGVIMYKKYQTNQFTSACKAKANRLAPSTGACLFMVYKASRRGRWYPECWLCWLLTIASDKPSSYNRNSSSSSS